MTIYYAITCLVSFLIIVLYIGLFDKKDLLFLLMFISVFLSNTGYFTLSISKNLEEALLANRIAYIGNVFLPFFLLITLMKVCKFKYHILFPYIMCIVNFIVLFITISGGYSTIYYKTVSFEIVDGAGRLVKEYGNLHFIYYVYLVGYFISFICVIGKSFFKKKVVSYKKANNLAIAIFLNIAIYFIEKLIDADIEYLCAVYIITEIFLLFISLSIEDYNISSIIQFTLQTDKTGVILFDQENKFKGCNDDAALIMPELNNLKLEYVIPENEHILQKYIVKALSQKDSSENVIFKSENKIYRITAKTFRRKGKENGKLLGTAVVLSDDTAQQEYLNLLSSYNKQLETEVSKKTAHVLQMHDNLIISMANMVESRDPNTGGHIKRTSFVVGIFIRKLCSLNYNNYSETFLNKIAKAAPMHDLGKIAIDDAILRKPGKYTAEEYSIMKTHAEKGAEIVGKILKIEDDEEFYNIAVNVAHYHHERYDGGGYPKGLKGEEIPFEARIMALADVFDALCSKRCYKTALPFNEAFEIIENSLGKHFDTELGKIFLSCKKELIEYYDNCKNE